MYIYVSVIPNSNAKYQDFSFAFENKNKTRALYTSSALRIIMLLASSSIKITLLARLRSSQTHWWERRSSNGFNILGKTFLEKDFSGNASDKYIAKHFSTFLDNNFSVLLQWKYTWRHHGKNLLPNSRKYFQFYCQKYLWSTNDISNGPTPKK